MNVGSLCKGKRRKSQKVSIIGKSIAESLEGLTPPEKSNALQLSLTPRTIKNVVDSYEGEGSSLGLFKTLLQRRDKGSNCTRQLFLGNTSLNKKRTRSNWTSVQRAVSKSVGDILIHYKTEKTKKVKPPSETQKLVHDYYNKDDVSRMLPYKKLTRRVKDHTGVYHRLPVRVMEVTLKKAYTTFKNLHPEVKICKRMFESLRPKNICLTRCAQRLQCDCTYHTNIEYSRKALHRLFLINGKESPVSSNDTLMNASLCDAKSFKCIMGRCKDCKSFSKIENLKAENLKCSKDCIKKRM